MLDLHSGIFAIQETRANIGLRFPSRLYRTLWPGKYNTRPRGAFFNTFPQFEHV